MVVNGANSGFAGDDFVKYLWFIRIANSAYPEVKEYEYYKDGNKWGIDEPNLSDKVAESVGYKMSYYRVGEMYTE